MTERRATEAETALQAAGVPAHAVLHAAMPPDPQMTHLGHLAEVEQALGGPLFHRTGRGVKRTELAEQLLPRVGALLAQADALRALITDRFKGRCCAAYPTVQMLSLPIQQTPNDWCKY